MTTKRVKFSNIVQNQLPGYVKSDYPLVAEVKSIKPKKRTVKDEIIDVKVDSDNK